MRQIAFVLTVVCGLTAGLVADPANAGPGWPITQTATVQAQ